MPNLNIAHNRLHNQHISQPTFEKVEDVVKCLCAVQAQDYAAAKWALGLRMRDSTDDIIEQAFNEGTILRTHVMRPTWHFVLPDDIRWMLALTAPRVIAASSYYYRILGLDDSVFKHTNTTLATALHGGKQLTRVELALVLRQAGITSDNLQRFGQIIMRAELDGIICSGARRGKQFTYALLDERAPQARNLAREEALAELTLRYFASHGPATLQDFVWWSGLTVTDAKIGLDSVTSQLMSGNIDGQLYWYSSSTPLVNDLSQAIYLLPNYDEYTVGYTDRSAILNESELEKFNTRGDVLNPVIVQNGLVIGTWKRTITKGSVQLIPNLFATLTRAENRALIEAAKHYGSFLQMPVSLDINLL